LDAVTANWNYRRGEARRGEARRGGYLRHGFLYFGANLAAKKERSDSATGCSIRPSLFLVASSAAPLAPRQQSRRCVAEAGRVVRRIEAAFSKVDLRSSHRQMARRRGRRLGSAARHVARWTPHFQERPRRRLERNAWGCNRRRRESAGIREESGRERKVGARVYLSTFTCF